MSADSPDWPRLGRLVQERRVQKGLSKAAAAEAAGISRGIWTGIENAAGTRPYDTTLAAVERALDWEPGSIRAVLQGGEPSIREQAAAGERVATDIEQASAIIAWVERAEGFDEDDRAFIIAKMRKVIDQAKGGPNSGNRALG